MPIATATKMTIVAYSDPGFTTKVSAPDNPFTVWINPASYQRNRTVRYNDRQASGSGGGSPEFNRVPSETMSMDLMFDATGAIPEVTGASYANGVSDGIAQLIALTGTINGDIHTPNYLILRWAQLQFSCVLTGINIGYTLFRPDGTPLRAKAAVTFESFSSETALAKAANLQSPDMTHLVTVIAGDTLPMLCHRVYGDSGYYLKVAEHNELVEFRRLEPGTQLVFPPLAGSA